ncbi:glycosyltransferase family 4 protein [Polaribacter sp. Hel1_85]|uniref:glycosyltransferase family 4 protein n=1 Tax=Polaribacter sp. Hel1_85 TaxID=1250005 RepID=UPI00052CF77E|nr:glycosyltransferase family 4 protein [Polaribacter sp. Hel1_85]KGL63248.1 glycosyltransferase, GT4 family [Polaribacter sp. Hel1_85]
MIKKRILYIGNNLVKRTNYNTSMEVLSRLLQLEGHKVKKSSSKNNKILRLLSMCLAVVKNSNKTDYILIDTFSTSNFYFSFITSQLARLFRIKYITILRGGNLPFRINKSVKISNLIFNNSYKNIAPSNYLKSEFEKKGYKTDFIPNILEIENYSFKKRIELKPKILWVRAFKELYNPTLAIKVLSLLKEKYPKAKLCMVGPGKDTSFEASRNLAKELNIIDSVEFTGVLPKEEWHKKAIDFDLFINTTNFDNTPVSVMEAMALGLPIISTNVGGMPFLIENNIDGVLVDKENENQMADAIIKIIEENNFSLALNGRKKAESFAWREVKQKWNQILV